MLTLNAMPMKCFNPVLLVCCLQCVSLFGSVLPIYADVLVVADEAIANNKPVLRFCYEDKQLLPYYTGDGQHTPAIPGATIEHLTQAAKQSDITLQLLRRPWLRCLQKLKDNSVDALVAAFDADRAHFTVYPQLPDGQADISLAINQLGLCLAYRYDNPLEEKINQPTNSITLARPLGYKPINFPANTVLVKAHSPAQALQLVTEGRVDTTTVLCQLNGIAAKERQLNLMPLKLLYPPLHQSYGYVMFSKAFYQRYPKHAEQLWQNLPKTLSKQRYLHYLNYPEM
jgi:polar amino acid transport system substrate-binding protein